MIPTSTDVYAQVRGIFEDNGVTSGDRWGDGKLRAFLKTAYETLFAQAKQSDVSLCHQYGYYNLRAYTGALLPSTAGINNIDVPVAIAARPITSTFTILSITADEPNGRMVVVSATPHGLASGGKIVQTKCAGIHPSMNGEFTVEVLDTTTYYINGIVVLGTYTASSGTGTIGTNQFQTLNPIAERDNHSNLSTIAAEVCNWFWDGRAIVLDPPINVTRQLWIKYLASDVMPLDPEFPLVVDGSLGFLAYHTAALTIMNVNPNLSQLFAAEAFGPTREAKDLRGRLGQIIRPKMRQENAIPIERAPFRPRRGSNASMVYGRGYGGLP